MHTFLFCLCCLFLPLNIFSEPVALKLKEHILYSDTEENVFGWIKVDDRDSMISQSTWIYIKSALDYYKEKKPRAIFLQLNTPGGEVFAAQKISDALRDFDTQYDIPVIAFIDNWAISAGAMLAYSCRFIATVSDGSMGAAEPVLQGEGGKLEAASEKMNSAIRADFANRAGFFNRNSLIAEAMVDKDIILVKRGDKILKLDQESQMMTTGVNPDIVISAKGKLLTLTAKEMMDLKVADMLLHEEKVIPLTLSEQEAGQYPLTKTKFHQVPFFKGIPQAHIHLFKMDYKMQFLSFLSHPAVVSVLFLAMMMGFYTEFSTPGFGFPGSIGLIALFLMALSSYALQVVNTLEIILLLTGIAFIAIDLFFIPTFGILGVCGAILAIIGLFGMMLPGIENIDFDLDTKTVNAAGEEFIRRLSWLSGTLVLGTLCIVFLSRYITPRVAALSRLVLQGNEQSGFISGNTRDFFPEEGAQGVVMMTLRPSGKVEIDKKLYDALSACEFIEKGEKVRVLKIEASTLIVERKL
jgi:membrane-bound serine protease (ClpP class)